eukprot:c27316_g1_i2 orf=207-1946(+)
MEADNCRGCGANSVLFDAASGVRACDSCGLVKEDTSFESAAVFNEGGEYQGTFVAHSDTGVLAATLLSSRKDRKRQWAHVGHGFLDRREHKRLYVLKKASLMSSLLRLPKERVHEVTHMLEIATGGEWGLGRWIDVLVGACIYITARQNRLPLSKVEVAEVVGCDVGELGRMFNRVLDVMDLTLPDVDPHIFLQRTISTFPPFAKLEKDMSQKLSRQGRLLLYFAHQRFITTGRHPLPVIAAVLMIVAEANQVKVGLDELSKELHIHNYTARLRLKELQESLIDVGQRLPWGKDITVKTFNRHLPFIVKYLETKMRVQNKESTAISETLQHQDWPIEENILQDNLKLIEFSVDSHEETAKHWHIKNSIDPKGITDQSSGLHDDPSNGMMHAAQQGVRGVDFEKNEALAIVEYNGGLSGSIIPEYVHKPGGVTDKRIIKKGSAGDKCRRLESCDMDEHQQCWTNSGWLEWGGLPPSFRASQVARFRRLAKMDSAKRRITLVRQDLAKKICTRPFLENTVSTVNTMEQRLAIFSSSFNNGTDEEIDSEDLIIEYLLLHGIAFLLSISQKEPVSPWMRIEDV